MRARAAVMGVALAGAVAIGAGLAAADQGGGPVGCRVVLFFSPQDPSQCRLALGLLGWVGLPGGPAELVGVVPAGSAPAAVDGQWLPAGMTVAQDTDLAGLGLSAELTQGLPAAPGSALLLDAAGALVWAGPGERLLLSAEPKPLTTDIDKSTWGKVKELFR